MTSPKLTVSVKSSTLSQKFGTVRCGPFDRHYYQQEYILSSHQEMRVYRLWNKSQCTEECQTD